MYISTDNKNKPELCTEMTKYLEQLKNNDRTKKENQQKSLKAQNTHTKKIKHILTSCTFREYTTRGVSKYKYKGWGVCKIFIEGKSYSLESPKITFIIKKKS